MAWARYTRATASRTDPRAFGTCDRCGFIWNRNQLDWQYQWAGARLQNRVILVCPSCMDVPQMQLRAILIPPDPVPIDNPRPDPYMLMAQSSTPDGYASGSPNTIATQDNDPITTESTIPLITEINITPTSTGYFTDD